MNQCKNDEHVMHDMLTYKQCIKCNFTVTFENSKGKLVMLGTQIGNPFDISPRVIDALKNTDFVICEHYDSFKMSLEDLNVTLKEDCSMFEFEYLDIETEEGLSNLDFIFDQINNGKNAVMIADQGMPLIMDPGHLIVKHAIKNNITITSFPGPDAPVNALHLSGLNPWDFIFLGSISSDYDRRLRKFGQMVNQDMTCIYFERDSVLVRNLTHLRNMIGPYRKIALCFNMTRENENIIRGTIDEVLEWLNNNGYESGRPDAEWILQLTVVVEGINPQLPWI